MGLTFLSEFPIFIHHLLFQSLGSALLSLASVPSAYSYGRSAEVLERKSASETSLARLLCFLFAGFVTTRTCKARMGGCRLDQHVFILSILISTFFLFISLYLFIFNFKRRVSSSFCNCCLGGSRLFLFDVYSLVDFG